MYRKNVAGQFIYFQLVNATTGAGLTGATVAVRRCIDGTFGAGGGTVTEDTGAGSSPGFYKYALAQADTNGNDIGVAFTATSAIPVEKTFITTAADPTDSVRLGLTSLPNAAAAGVAGLPVLDANSLVDVDVKRWLATAVAAATAGVPNVNATAINNVATTSVSAINANVGTTQPLNFTGTGASALVQSDVQDWKGAAVGTPAAAGIPDINVKNINNVATTAVTTVSANQGTTQPVNFTGLGASALIKADAVDIAGAAVSTTTAQIGVNAVQINGVATTAVTAVNANQGTTQPVNFTGTAGSALVKSDTVDVAGAAVSAAAAQLGVNVVNIAGSAVSATAAQLGVNVVNYNNQVAQTDANNLPKVDIEAINANTTAPQNVAHTMQAIARGTCGAGSTFTNIVTSAFSPTPTDVGQLIGRVVIFDANTTTSGLRGQATIISNSTASATPSLTVTALTSNPVSGDTFSVV